MRVTHCLERLMSALEIWEFLVSRGARVAHHFEWFMSAPENLGKLQLQSSSRLRATCLSHEKVRMLGRWLLVKRSLNAPLRLSNAACLPCNDCTAGFPAWMTQFVTFPEHVRAGCMRAILCRTCRDQRKARERNPKNIFGPLLSVPTPSAASQ